MVVVLPEPLTPTTSTTNGFVRADGERLGDRRQHLLDLGGEHRLHLVRRDGLAIAALADGGGDPRRDVDAEIGADQRLLDLVEHLRSSGRLTTRSEIGAADRRRTCA